MYIIYLDIIYILLDVSPVRGWDPWRRVTFHVTKLHGVTTLSMAMKQGVLPLLPRCPQHPCSILTFLIYFYIVGFFYDPWHLSLVFSVFSFKLLFSFPCWILDSNLLLASLPPLRVSNGAPCSQGQMLEYILGVAETWEIGKKIKNFSNADRKCRCCRCQTGTYLKPQLSVVACSKVYRALLCST